VPGRRVGRRGGGRGDARERCRDEVLQVQRRWTSSCPVCYASRDAQRKRRRETRVKARELCQEEDKEKAQEWGRCQSAFFAVRQGRALRSELHPEPPPRKRTSALDWEEAEEEHFIGRVEIKSELEEFTTVCSKHGYSRKHRSMG
jgi:hypothetical protein